MVNCYEILLKDKLNSQVKQKARVLKMVREKTVVRTIQSIDVWMNKYMFSRSSHPKICSTSHMGLSLSGFYLQKRKFNAYLYYFPEKEHYSCIVRSGYRKLTS